MINMSEIKYYAVAVGDNGKHTDITDYVNSLAWSESKGELSMKSQFTARNDKTESGYLSEIIKPGSLFLIIVTTGKETKEVARGRVEVWNPVTENETVELTCTCYDDLYPFQKSQDNYIVKNNTRAYKALSKFFHTWKIPRGFYDGPSIKLKKMVFQQKYLGDIITQILNQAYELGDEKYFMRAADGVIDILPYFDNIDIYFFNNDNATKIDEKQSTENLVTRVKIMDKANKKMKANVDGLTEFGIRQIISPMQEGQSLKTAKKLAERVIAERGVIERSIKLSCNDLPFLRKGDVVYVDIGTSVGYFDVTGVTHQADSYTMTMNLEYSDKNASEDGKIVRKKKYVKGDIVNFVGGEYHLSAKKNSKFFTAVAGKAKISRIANKKYPYRYRLVHTNVASTINGYVTEEQFY